MIYSSIWYIVLIKYFLLWPIYSGFIYVQEMMLHVICLYTLIPSKLVIKIY